jgi:hypothetical protein
MVDKNIIDYPEVSVVADDDYILLDSESGGTSKILASRLTKPYEDIELQNGQLILRVYEDGTVIWYFNEFVYYGGDDHYAIPTNLRQFLPTPPSSDAYSYMTASFKVKGGEQGSEQYGWIGFLMNYYDNPPSVRSWNMSLSSVENGTFNGRLILGADTQGGSGYRQQLTEYIAP